MTLTGWWPVILFALLVIAALVWSMWEEHRTWMRQDDEQEREP